MLPAAARLTLTTASGSTRTPLLSSIESVKLSVSLPDDDIAFLDEYTTSHGVPSRSAALQQAVALLRAQELSGSYTDAWAEWEPEAQVWEPTVADGLDVR